MLRTAQMRRAVDEWSHVIPRHKRQNSDSAVRGSIAPTAERLSCFPPKS